MTLTEQARRLYIALEQKRRTYAARMPYGAKRQSGQAIKAGLMNCGNSL